ncbi:MAG: hydrolase [Candidatus Rokubacteria bacterium]|nr:hydrolase [Candidatus Rokubacteria bacterium]
MPAAILLIVDVQERLFNAMDADRRDEMIKNIKILAQTATRLGLPIVVTEQYPKGLGGTLPELRELLRDVRPFEKTAFSCCGADGFVERLRATGAEHVVVAGMEAHVCVLLTTLDLLRGGYRVTVAADAVCSRTRANADVGLAEARQAGAVVSSTETIVFRWLGRADTDVFREISKLLR